jgi:Ca-activated chloride channel family protein
MNLMYPAVLAGLLLLPLFFVLVLRRRSTLRFPTLKIISAGGIRSRLISGHLLTFFRLVALGCIIVAAARPLGENRKAKRDSEGLDIVLAIDTSKSMEARDFRFGGGRPTRLDVVKQVISDFVRDRPSDRIGMVVFGSEAFTQAPLTLDHEVLQRFLSQVRIGMAGDATAIGDGIAASVKRLQDIEAKSKVVILLTDGSNTAGRIEPLVATDAAVTLGIKVYTIGVGSEGDSPTMMNGLPALQRHEIDVDLLKEISGRTGGQFFLATDAEALAHIYNTIDQLEKTKLRTDSFEQMDDRYELFAFAGLGFLLVELFGALTRFRRIP